MVQKIGQITNADLYLNDLDVKGRVSEFEPGEIGHQEVEHDTLGMIGVLKLPGRPVQAIEGKIKFDWLDEEVQRVLMNPTKSNRLQLHSYVDVFDADGLNTEQSHTLVTHIGFNTMKSTFGAGKLGEKMGVENPISIHSFVQKIYGDATPIIEFDAFANIYNINGEAVWPR